MDTSLSIYRSVFVRLIEADSESIIENNSPEHAKVILQELVRCAVKSVFILCTHFSKAVYGDADLQTAILDAIDRGVSVSIAVRDKNPQEAEFFRKLRKMESEKCRLFEGLLENESHPVFPSDFCIVDGKRFRLERDQDKGTAFVCANNTEVVERLEVWFNLSVGAAA